MRRYFEGLYGNRSTKDRIANAILEGRLPHAFIIDGYEGSGKLTLALEIAAALNCENKDSDAHALPCRVCPSCKKILARGHVDVTVVERENGRQLITVDQIREIRKDMYLTSTEAEYKVYIIRNAERMNTEAQNALLIALEEPPKNVVIMLLSEGTDKLLTTIKSRAQYIAMEHISNEGIEDYIIESMPEAMGIRISDEVGFRLAVMGSDGRIGLCKRLLMPKEREQLNEEREDAIRILESITGGYDEVLAAISLLPTSRESLSLYIERLMIATRDLVAIYHSQDAPLTFFISREEAEDLAYKIGITRLFRFYDALVMAHSDLSKMANINALTSLLGARMKSL